MARPVDKSPRRVGKRAGSRPNPRKAASRPTTRRKMFSRATTNYNMPHPHLMGGISPTPSRNQREGREAEIGLQVAFATTQSAGRTAPPTPDNPPLDARAPATEGRARWMCRRCSTPCRVGGDGGSRRSRRRVGRMSLFLCLFLCFLFFSFFGWGGEGDGEASSTRTAGNPGLLGMTAGRG